MRSQVTARNIKLPPNPAGPLLVRKSHSDEMYLTSRRTPPLPRTPNRIEHRTNQTKTKKSIQYSPPPQMESAPNPPLVTIPRSGA